jgi:hypothetical protein
METWLDIVDSFLRMRIEQCRFEQTTGGIKLWFKDMCTCKTMQKSCPSYIDYQSLFFEGGV